MQAYAALFLTEKTVDRPAHPARVPLPKKRSIAGKTSPGTADATQGSTNVTAITAQRNRFPSSSYVTDKEAVMNWRHHTNYRVYLVTDRELCLGRPLEDVVLAAVRGGAGAVQLREKHASSREFLELARALVSRIQPLGIPLIINDRADIALASGAAGLHVGQSDLPPGDARLLMGPKAIVGLSVETPEELKEAEAYDIDYVGLSPVFATPTKTDTHTPWGLEGLREARALSPLRLVAIGGIHNDNAAAVVEAGAHSLAVVSEICSAEDPEEATRRLLAAFDSRMSRQGAF